MIKSRALEINLARTQVDVAIDPQYHSLQQVMSQYYGLREGLNAFLKEISHPYKNWQFIVDGTRGYALDYFHIFKNHPQGPEGAQKLIDIFCRSLASDAAPAVKVDAADNLTLYIQKIIKSADDAFGRFLPVIESAFDFMYRQPAGCFVLFERSFYSLHRIAADLIAGHDHRMADFASINRLLARALADTYTYWLNEKDPLQWFLTKAGADVADAELEKIFEPVSHGRLQSYQAQLEQMKSRKEWGSADLLKELLSLIDYHKIVQTYRRIPQLLLDRGGRNEQGNQWKVIFLFHMMNTAGLALIHEDTLRDINRTLNWLIANQNPRYISELIEATFSILKANVHQYPSTALACVGNMGSGIFKTDDIALTDHFIDQVIELGFQAPMISGVGNNWQIMVNSAHIQNIRTWMELVESKPKRATRLLSNLIIHLAVSGVFIRDTDLFGRDITRFLNSGIGPVYNLAKQLTRQFPVYFNDIGAEGELRDISTRIDEICHRRDPLIHFLRKQSHVEGSNRILNFMEEALQFWATKKKAGLTAYLPPNIYDLIESDGLYIDGVHKLLKAMIKKGITLPQGLIDLSQEQIESMALEVKGITDTDRERVVLFAEFYKQINNKYKLGFLHIRQYLDQLSAEAFPEMHSLREALDETELKTRIFKLLEYLNLLKGLILSPKTFPVREDIYKKRHFTVDIPSMYGSYNELKFDAMGLTLRLEALVNVLFEELINTIDLSLITKATCYQIYDRLMLFNKALHVDGIASAELEQQLDLLAHSLEIRGFSFTQFLDIYKGFAQAVKNIINDYFNNVHGEHLTRILSQLPADWILPKYHPVEGPIDQEKLVHRTSEIFFRDGLASSLGLQQLDLFLSRILNTLYHQSNKLPKEKLRRLLNYDPQRAVFSICNPNELATGIIYLGNKGLNMLKLKNFGLPIPPAFIITTEVFRCREIIESFQPAKDNFKDQVVQHVRQMENRTAKSFGDPQNPLLFSVRSGSSVSQPGMMDTFLNVGINEQIAEGLADQSGNIWFAWDCYRRFLQGFGMSLGLKRDDFDAIISDFKSKLGIPLKKAFTGEQMKRVALAYKDRINQEGFLIPEDPLDQLFQTIQSVMNSWESAKAKSYRQIMGISDDWGTAVTVQAMVYGNISQLSGSGVIFTHNPRWAGDSLSLWGDFTLENQGEDVVAGLVQTLPISIKQQEMEMRDTDTTLETHCPQIYQAMRNWARMLTSEKGWSPQEMEFTFESPSVEHLYLLQTRDMAIRERKRVLTFDPQAKEQTEYLGHGIGVSGGAMSGRLIFSLEEVEYWRENEPDTALILARGDTVPDDIREINAADGLLTARGGVTSHASVVAHRLGKTCVVGCGNLICDEKKRTVTFGQSRLSSGAHISIDGREGSVYQGILKIKEA